MEEQGMLLNQIDFDTILDEIRKRSDSTSEKGTLFEDLCVQVLKVAPIFNDITHVRKWSEFPGNGGYHDSGIDIVAQKEDGEFYAYQCKFYKDGEKITRDDVNKFITQAQIPFTIDGKKYNFNKDLVVLTSVDEFSENVKQLADVVRIFGHDDFVSCGIDWSEVDLDKIEEIKRVGKKVLKSHQVDAINALIKGFVNDNDERGRLTMACGTGKTFTSLKFLEKYKQKTEKEVLNILYLVPSISLLSQTIFEWNNNLDSDYKACNFGICSDSTAGREKGRRKTIDENIIKMPIKSTTNVNDIFESYKKEKIEQGFNFFFSTYQSINVVHQFQEKSDLTFDFIICDEAHRTIGSAKLESEDEDKSSFVLVHDGNYIKSEKRLYMTATEKIFVEKAKNKAKDNGYEIYSMDDESIYGKRLYLLTFGEAISRNLLMDYRVMVLTIDKKELASIKLPNISLEFSAKILGSLRGMSKIANEENPDEFKNDPQQMQRVVAFTSTIDDAEDAAKAYESLKNKTVLGEEKLLEKKYVLPSARIVKGSFSSEEKNKRLKWLKSDDIKPHECRILTNARCLSEGVDVPALDGVVFLAQKQSQVDIIQAVGRVMRKFGAGSLKKFGYIIIPIIVDGEENVSQTLSNNPDFKIVWQVVQALRSHDERLDENINAAKLTGKLPANIILLNNFNINVNSPRKEGRDSDDPEAVKSKQKVQIELLNVFIPELVKHCGDRLYWEDWSKNIGEVTTNISYKIKHQIVNKDSTKNAFERFLKGLRSIINPYINEDTAISMLSSHIVVIPVLKAIFGTAELIDENEISKIMNKMVSKIENIEGETKALQSFYEDVKRQVESIKDGKGRQELIRILFEKFFQYAMPKDAEKFGIVYTPIEIVDFIINSVNDALKENFNKTLADKGVKTLDPFTGTGTFIVRLLEKIHELGSSKEELTTKYNNDIWCNEIMILAYYIALINIEDIYSRLNDDYLPFSHALLTDTFQLSEGRISGSEQQKIELEEFATATKLMKEEDQQNIRIIIANPPYSVGQKSSDDENKNNYYEKLSKKVQNSYGFGLKSNLVKSLYDSYVLAFRWATDRIGNDGIISFVSNGSYLDNKAFSGFRRELLKDFNHIYIYNLRGNQRTMGELSRKEGGKIFGSGSRNTICIILLIKKQGEPYDGFIHYKDIGDYLSREDKLEIIKNNSTYKNVGFIKIYPDENFDFINKKDNSFEKLMDMQNEIFNEKNFVGLVSGRDLWNYNFSKIELTNNMFKTTNFYNELIKKSIKIEINKSKISWTPNLISSFLKKKPININNGYTEIVMYRPFVKKYLFHLADFIERPSQWQNYISKLFLCLSGNGNKKGFSVLIVNCTADYQMLFNTKVESFYSKEYEDNVLGIEFDENSNINEKIIFNFKNKYDNSITAIDIFYYIYALFHSRSYRGKYANNLMKEFPRIPYLKDFWGYSNIGRKLAGLHLNYESASKYRVNIEDDGKEDDIKKKYHVTKIRFLTKDRKDTIIFNEHITIRDIPLEAYDYEVNGRSPIEWVMDQYQYTIDKESGIVDDPNEFDEVKGGKYIFDLILSLITVSLETQKLIKLLPEYEEI